VTNDDDQPTFDELRELLGVNETPDEENPDMLGAVCAYEAWAKRLAAERDEWLRRREQWRSVVTEMRKRILRAWLTKWREDA